MKIVSYNSNPRNKTLVIISGLAVIVLFALLIHPRSFNVSDVDVFYHIRHSWIYSQNGLTFSEFPWTQFSVIKEYSADLWYGFHVLSVPLTYFNNLLDGMWVGGLIVTTSALLIIWFALRRLPIKWPLLLTLIISLLSADFLYRLTMFRPHPITVGLTLGLVLRPNPIGAIKLAYVQVLQLLTEKQSHLPLSFGQELLPLAAGTIKDQLIPILVLFAGTLFFWLGFFLKKKWNLLPAHTRHITFSSFIVSVVFFVLALTIARRSIDFFVPFAVIFFAVTFSSIDKEVRQIILGKAYRAIIFIVIAVIIFGSVKNYSRFRSFIPHAFSPERFQDVGLWMKSNLPAKKTVFVSQWDYFPELFFWNHNNYYINGMDPIFEFTFSPSLYWKTHFLATDTFFIDNGIAKICGEVGCTADNIEDVKIIIKQDFDADYLFIDKEINPKLFEFVRNASGFSKLYENSRAAIYKVL